MCIMGFVDTNKASSSSLAIYQSPDNQIRLDVNVAEDTVWLNVDQISSLYKRDRSVIQRHIRNTYKEEEVLESSTCAKFAQVRIEGDREVVRQVPFYNLDVIISVGYRVHSKEGVLFRKWATGVLRQHIFEGYSVNIERLSSLGKSIQVLKRYANLLQSNSVLNVIESYAYALNLLDQYDHKTMEKPIGNIGGIRITYQECNELINSMMFYVESDLFGRERNHGLEASIGAVFQTVDGHEVYPTVEEKAAHLLYFLVKNHPFVDGNKRIGSAIFLYFLQKNKTLLNEASILPDQNVLVAVVVLMAASDPSERDSVIKLVLNLLTNPGNPDKSK